MTNCIDNLTLGEIRCAEDCLKEKMERKGFVVAASNKSTNGHDIVAIKDDEYFIIEVKKENAEGRFRVDQFTEGCDFIVCVSGSGFCFHKELPTTNFSKVVRFYKAMGWA
jgi:hypothetical protein